MNEYICTQSDEIIELHDTERDILDVYIPPPINSNLFDHSYDEATLNITTVRFHKVPIYFRKWVETSQGMNGDSFGYWVKIKTHKWETDEMMEEDGNTYLLTVLRENEDLRSKIRSMLEGDVDPYNISPMAPKPPSNIHKGKSHEDKEWGELFTIE